MQIPQLSGEIHSWDISKYYYMDFKDHVSEAGAKMLHGL